MNAAAFILAKHGAGASITETMKAVMVQYGVSLKEAKTMVSSHPVWASVVSATEPLLDELFAIQDQTPPVS